MVDTLGLIWAQEVSAASVQDRDGAVRLLPQLEAHSERLQVIYADGAYAGRFLDIASYFYGVSVQRVHKLTGQKGFVVLPQRWKVERTLAWLSKNRRLSKDYEFEPKSSEAMVRWASVRRMTRLLTRPDT